MKWNICLFIPVVVMWLRDDNLWTNLNQFCVNIMELIVFITHIWLYGRFYISEFTCFASFPPTYVAFIGHVSRKSCCDWMATANYGGHWRIWGTIFIASIGHNFYWTIPVNLYCTYTVIISSDCSEALNLSK